jgi:flagellar biosynthetic protein FlhB
MAEQDLDRNEAATPYKLEKAKEKGQVAKSADFTSAVVFAVAVVFMMWQGWVTVREQFRIDQALLTAAMHADPGGAGLWPLTKSALQSGLSLCAPLFGAIVIAAIVGNLMQSGPVFSLDPITADFERINPVSGLKKLFSMQTLFNGARTCLKLIVFAWVSFYALRSLAPQFYGLAYLSPVGYVRTFIDDMSDLGLKLALALGVVALIDFMYTKMQFAKKMRMSRREIKDETKHRDGDPRIRARLRELRREMLKRSMSVRNTRNADVLLTNPTHVAVAVKYTRGEMESPLLVAKGAGQLAASMRKIAEKHHIPIVRSPALARRMFQDMEVNQHVPPHLYADVARIIVWVFAMRERRQTNAHTPLTTRRPGGY